METRCNQPLVIISVDTFYQEKYSAPVEGKYVHAYRITIENKSDFPIKLLKRSWKIMEGNGLVKKVKGEGVLGQQPIINPLVLSNISVGHLCKTILAKWRGCIIW
jgi:ApaG protein